jgi:hypothetical protein
MSQLSVRPPAAHLQEDEESDETGEGRGPDPQDVGAGLDPVAEDPVDQHADQRQDRHEPD